MKSGNVNQQTGAQGAAAPTGAMDLNSEIQALRLRYASFASRPAIGDKNLRPSGGVSLRVMDIADSEAPPVA